ALVRFSLDRSGKTLGFSSRHAFQAGTPFLSIATCLLFAMEAPAWIQPHSSSASRFTAGASGFLNFSQSFHRPERERGPSRFDTIPSSPILQAWRKTNSPSWARCSFRRSPGRLLRSRLASVALRVSSGSRRRSWPSSSRRSKAERKTCLARRLAPQPFENRESVLLAGHRLSVAQARADLQPVNGLDDEPTAAD